MFKHPRATTAAAPPAVYWSSGPVDTEARNPPMRPITLLSLAALAACAGANPTPSAGAATQTISVQGAGSLTMGHDDSPHELSVPLTVAQVWAVMPAVYDSL